MASKSTSITAILVLLATFLLLLAPHVEARPTAIGKYRLDARAAGSSTFTTKTTKTDSNGQVFTESCTVVLTPITVNGQDEVQEIRACNTAPGTTDPGPPPAPPTDQTSATGGASSSAAATASATGSAAQATATGTATTSAASVPPAAFTIIGDSSIARSDAHSATGAAAPTSAAGASATGTASASASGSASISASGSASASAAASTTPTSASASASASGASAEGASVTGSASATATAAASSQSPTTQFSLPGKTLSVLPIGLGVFAGISVIALIVVGLVTYERTKYRKAFRARKLAEAGGAMGYGGMAEARV